MKQNELTASLEEAKKRYPIGTKFRLSHDPRRIFTIESHDYHHECDWSNNYINLLVIEKVRNCKTASVWDSKNGWAEIVSLPKVVEQPEFKILSYMNIKSGIVSVLDEERDRYFTGHIYLRNIDDPNLKIHSVMNKDGNTFDIDDEITLIEGVNKGNKFTITGFRMKKDGSTVCAITESHTPYGVGINKIEHYIEKEPIVIPNETLLEKAKRLYPVGTKFKRFFMVSNNSIATVISEAIQDNHGISVRCEDRSLRFVYHNGTWAEIIEEAGPKVGDKFQFQENKLNDPKWSPVHTIEKFEGSLRNPNSVISFTGNYPGAKTQTVLLKNVKFIKDEK